MTTSDCLPSSQRANQAAPLPLLPTAAIGMQRAIADRLIDDDVAITDFDIVQARGVGANPSLVLNGSSLAAEIRKRNQITITTLATPGKSVFHEIASFLLSGGYVARPYACTGRARLTRKLAEGEPPPLHPHPHSRLWSMPPLSYHKSVPVSAGM